jgi:hypothetical protein
VHTNCRANPFYVRQCLPNRVLCSFNTLNSFSFQTLVRSFAIITGRFSSFFKYTYFKCLGKDFNSSFEAYSTEGKTLSCELESCKGELTKLSDILNSKYKDTITSFMSSLFSSFVSLSILLYYNTKFNSSCKKLCSKSSCIMGSIIST